MYDVAIIGAGVTGSAIARELSRYQLDIVVLEKGSDVAWGSSRANSGIVHGGYDAVPGTRKAHYNMAGNRCFEQLSEELDFPFSRCGSLVVAFEEDDFSMLERLRQQGIQNGLEGLRIIGQDAVRRLEPNASDKIIAALEVPSGGIVCPYEMTIALAENAAMNGVTFCFDSEVTEVGRQDNAFSIRTADGKTRAARLLVNAAGLYADTINNTLSAHAIEIIPRKGEYCLLDKSEDGLVRHTIFQLPGKMGKGTLLTLTVDGNVLIGPTAYDIPDKDDTSTTKEGLAEVWVKAEKNVRDPLPRGNIITAFSGLRAHATTDDFIIGFAPDVDGLLNVAGIESPGLTSAPAIGQEVAAMVADALQPKPKPDFQPRRQAAPRFRHLDHAQREALIQENPDYGQIVCRCESVSRAEIVAALNGPLPIRSLDALKRRTRAGMGRCQAGFCSMRLPEIIAETLQIPLTEVVKSKPGTNLLLFRNKEEYPCVK